MSVVVKSQCGWVLDTAETVTNHYRTCAPLVNSELFCSYECRKELFAIHQPFRMDSQFEKLVRDAETETQFGEIDHRKKRKRKHRASNCGELAAGLYHEQVKDYLTSSLAELVKKGFEVEYFTKKPDVPLDNNLVARSAAQLEGPGDELLTRCQETCSKEVLQSPVDLIEDKWQDEDLFNRVIKHERDVASIIHCLGADYFIPPRCRFLMSDITSLKPLLQDNQKFDAIVIDPPWKNKSVKRKKKYKTLDDWDFYDLPIPDLASDDCIILVWVTNKQKQRDFVKDTLFPHWSVVVEAEWHWIKVTKHAETVFPMDSPHKKPYEAIIVGRITKQKDKDSLQKIDKKVIVSIPCCIHSRKPPLSDILKDFLPAEAQCLEMFARNLLPGWTSWGNEVLRFQHTDFFVRRESLASH